MNYVYLALAAAILLALAGVAGLRALSRRWPANLGAAGGRLAPCSGAANCVSSQMEDARHHVESLPLCGSPQETLRCIRDVLGQMPAATVVSSGDGYLHAEFASRFLGFVDDVEFLVDPEAEVLHVRSASRVGYWDLGVNRRRVEQIRRLLERRETAPKP